MWLQIILGLVAGLHAACYGAYKDSPYELFKLNRFFREILLGGLIAFGLWYNFPELRQNSAIFFLTCLAFSRILTEAYKQFWRIEPQTRFKIPSMAHIFKHVPTSIWLRLSLAGIGVCFIYGFYQLANFVSQIVVPAGRGFSIGFINGALTALGGAYKDSLYEGFSLRKFFRSPLVGGFAGWLLYFYTRTPFELFFASLGLERMVVEFYKGFVKSCYVPGKFKTISAAYPNFFKLRQWLILPYAGTWLIFIFILID